MRKEKTKDSYFCDVCGEEIETSGAHWWAEVNRGGDVDSEYSSMLDLCEECSCAECAMIYDLLTGNGFRERYERKMTEEEKKNHIERITAKLKEIEQRGGG